MNHDAEIKDRVRRSLQRYEPQMKQLWDYLKGLNPADLSILDNRAKERLDELREDAETTPRFETEVRRYPLRDYRREDRVVRVRVPLCLLAENTTHGPTTIQEAQDWLRSYLKVRQDIQRLEHLRRYVKRHFNIHLRGQQPKPWDKLKKEERAGALSRVQECERRQKHVRRRKKLAIRYINSVKVRQELYRKISEKEKRSASAIRQTFEDYIDCMEQPWPETLNEFKDRVQEWKEQFEREEANDSM